MKTARSKTITVNGVTIKLKPITHVLRMEIAESMSKLSQTKESETDVIGVSAKMKTLCEVTTRAIESIDHPDAIELGVEGFLLALESTEDFTAILQAIIGASTLSESERKNSNSSPSGASPELSPAGMTHASTAGKDASFSGDHD